METDLSTANPSCFSAYMASPSWFPAHRNPSRFHLLGHEAPDRTRRWRRILKRLVKEGKKSIYCSKPLTFGYDAVSYSKNFDDGCRGDGSRRFLDVAGSAGLPPRSC